MKVQNDRIQSDRIQNDSTKDNGKFRILAIGNVWNAQFHFPFHRPKFPFLKRLSYRLYNRNKILKTNYILLLFCARVIIMKSLVTFMAKNVLVWEKQGFNQQNFFLVAFKKTFILFVYILTTQNQIWPSNNHLIWIFSFQAKTKYRPIANDHPTW